MPEPPRRKRFQIHLSTAIVLMFVAGGIMLANFNQRRVEIIGTAIPLAPDDNVTRELTESEFLRSQQYIGWSGFRESLYGWPFDIMRSRILAIVQRNGINRVNYDPDKKWEAKGIALNACVALVILLSVWFFCEWLIRRRTARKDALPMPERPRRKRFQIHLSTAVVMMFVAGGLIWANTRENRTVKIQRSGMFSSAFEKMIIVSDIEYFSHRRNEDYAGLFIRDYGMPFDAKHSSSTVFINFVNYQGRIVSTSEFWNLKAVALNVLIACAALLGVAFLSEWLIRRRAASKDA